MRRNFKVVMVLILSLLVCFNQSCAKKNNEVSFVASHNIVELSNGEKIYVNLEMKNGSCFKGETGGGTYQTNWKGEYQIRVFEDVKDGEKDICIFPIQIDEKIMNFDKEFQIVFDDYNDDTYPDFTLGQYGGSSFNIYRLYTILLDGSVKELKCNNGSWMMSASHDFSIQLDKLTSTAFQIKVYDNEQAKLINKVYEWKDQEFVLKK